MTVDERIAAVGAALDGMERRTASPAPRPALAHAMADGRVPPELGALYQASDGLSLDEGEVWDLADMLDFSGRERIAREYPGGAAFGWNRSDVVFVLDAEGSMHAGAGAVLGVDSVYPGPESAVLCAPDLGSFVTGVAAGARPWRAPRLIRQQATQLAELIALRPDRVDARPPLSPDDRAAALAMREVDPGPELRALLEMSDGLRFARSGLTIAGARELSAYPGLRRADGAAAAIRIGRIADGPDLVVTTAGAPRPTDLVLQVRPDTDPLAAPAFGRLLPVLAGWIASDAENAP